MLETIKDQWLTLLLIPFFVSIIANIFTPFFQRMAVSTLATAATKLNNGANGILRFRVKQINKEISEINLLTTNQTELMKHYQLSISYVGFGLWVLLWSPFIATIAVKLSSYFPETTSVLFGNPNFVFSATIAALFSAGPLQAAIYSSYISKRLKKLENNPQALIEKLEKEREKISTIVGQSQ